MIKIAYNYNKKDFIKSFRSWFIRTPICILFESLYLYYTLNTVSSSANRICSLNTGSVFNLLYLYYPGLCIKDVVHACFLLLTGASAFLFLIPLLSWYVWNMFRKIENTYLSIKAVTFYETYMEIEYNIENTCVSEKISYTELSQVKIQKPGLILRKKPFFLFVYKNLFATVTDYKTVCNWIQEVTIL